MKRTLQFNHLFLMTATMLTIVSCGANKNNSATTGFSSSLAMTTTKDLTTAERTIATRICYAYQSKSTSFKTQTYFGGSYTFNMTKKDCSDRVESYSIVGVLQSKSTGEFYYLTSSPQTFSSKVQTSNSGFLVQLCSKIQNNLPVSNTAVDGNTTVQVAFTSTDLDTYTLNYFVPQNNVMKIQYAETFKVRTQFNQGAGQILGMDEVYTKQAVCDGNDAKFSEFSQKFASFVSK